MKRGYARTAPKYPAPDHTHYLVAVDLGKTKIGLTEGWASASLGARITKSSTLQCPKAWGDRPDLVAQAIADRIPEGALVVLEWPVKYPKLRAKHKDIDSLLAVGNELKKLVNVVEVYTPHQWKGNIVKKAHHRRIRKVLTDVELENIEEGHDAWDAAGIWLFAAARTGRGGVKL